MLIHCLARARTRAPAGVAFMMLPVMLLAVSRPAQAQQPIPPDTVPSARQDSARLDSLRLDSLRLDSLQRYREAHPAMLRAVTITTTSAERNAPGSATRVSARTIELAPAATPYELLRQTAGVEVHQQGQGPGFASDASVRGFSSDHSTDLALWIDGVPINEPVNGHAEGYNDFSVIFPDAVRDMDVIKGPTSALFGNFALSGVVNVRTLERMTGTRLSATAGSYGRADVSLLSGFDHGADGGGVFGIRAQHEDGFRPDARNDLVQGHARLVRDLTPAVTIDGGAELYGARWMSPGYLSEDEFATHQYDIVSNPSDGGFKQRAQERVSVQVTHGPEILWRTTAYATQGRWQLYLTIPPAGGRFEGSGSQTEEEDHRYGLGLTSALTYDGQTAHVTLGTEDRFNHSRYENYFTTARARDSVNALLTGRQLSGALFLQSSLDPTPRLRFDLGARYDAIETWSLPTEDTPSTLSAMHGVFSPKLGALVRVTPELALYGNVSRGFRSTDGVIEDPTLAPITVWAYETGLKLDRGAASASVALFRMNVSNEQTFNPIAAGSVSGGASRRQGVELELATPVTDWTHVNADWTFNDARYTHEILEPEDSDEPPADVSGLRVYNTARYVGSAALDVAPPRAARWRLRVSGNWVGPYSPFDEPGVVLGAYGLMHVAAIVDVTRQASLDLGVRDVLDRAYPEVVAGHIVAPGEPRAAYVTLRLRM